MTAYSNDFPWPSYYGHYDFFEHRMAEHSRVQSIMCSQQTGLYHLTKVDGKKVTIFICDCYSFGVAEYDESVTELGSLDAIIINSNWCGYTIAVKRHCRAQKIGIFTIGEFMAALSKPKLWEYLTPEQKKLFTENGWL
jgi:hypothetical protein